ncbi:unnamed protein product [Schistosoma mattheei]|uniref:Uncharacterized protein n=1 Tax=Schistosoma mattheei TaxID=31246 RepID=A0A183PXE2_9TREM|nr:unnamed protein product [Schistosoma mattheei]
MRFTFYLCKGFQLLINLTHYAVKSNGNQFIFFSSDLCQYVSLFQNNDIDIEVEKLQALQNDPDPSVVQLESESKAKSLKIGKSRRLLRKELKREWLEVSDCCVFW